MMLRGMGFDNTTVVYVAAGIIYKADKFMEPLRKLFPLLETKDSLATPEELAPFQVLSLCYLLNIRLKKNCRVENLDNSDAGPLVQVSSS